jgi:predicted TIM-barrel fold metal-dependent hydrolase
VDGKAWGEKDNGHVLPLALGFPFETTVVSLSSASHIYFLIKVLYLQATTRLILSGVFDRFPSLRVLLAHSGGALPQLSSRLASCIDHDPIVASRLKHDARYYLGTSLWFDAVAYGSEELGFVSDVISRSEGYEKVGSPIKKAADRKIGSKRMMFGTDHPFFPPLSNSEKWGSVVENLDAIDGVQGWTQHERDNVRGGNALSLFSICS